MTEHRLLTEDEKTTLADCSKLVGCQMLKCLDIPHACWQSWDVSQPSRGLGDTIAKVTHFTGIDLVVKAVATATGTDCGCGARQDSLNKTVPYKGV